jgi:hypothetical protein
MFLLHVNFLLGHDTYTAVSPSIVIIVDENTLALPLPTSPPPHPTYQLRIWSSVLVSPFASVETSRHLSLSLSLCALLALPRASSEEWLSSKRGTAARLSAGLGWASAGTECTVGPLRSNRSQAPGFSTRPATHQRNQSLC